MVGEGATILEWHLREWRSLLGRRALAPPPRQLQQGFVGWAGLIGRPPGGRWQTLQRSEIDPQLEVSRCVQRQHQAWGVRQWSSWCTRPRAVHSMFTQVFIAACQLLWNNIESGLGHKCHFKKEKEVGEKKRKRLFIISWANASWTLSQLGSTTKTLVLPNFFQSDC